MITEYYLKFALCHFITKVKKVNGSDFTSKTIYDIIVCIQFHLECMGFNYKLIIDATFKFTLDNTIKACTAQGIGITIRKAQVLSATDEDLLWSLRFLGTTHPKQLLNTVVFSISKGFALWVGKEHHESLSLQFTVQVCDWPGWWNILMVYCWHWLENKQEWTKPQTDWS